ncbi:MAG TPA: hypothetical protein VLT36_24500, partial [Candidatus Dormibacteraeota bacterium]|nr:hypothetical protein [Candidatus Dormibacteraeota bacterium]
MGAKRWERNWDSNCTKECDVAWSGAAVGFSSGNEEVNLRERRFSHADWSGGKQRFKLYIDPMTLFGMAGLA